MFDLIRKRKNIEQEIFSLSDRNRNEMIRQIISSIHMRSSKYLGKIIKSIRFYVRSCVVDPIFQKADHVLLFPNFSRSMKESFIFVSIYESCISILLSLSLSLSLPLSPSPEITFHLKCFIVFGKASNLLFSSLRIMAQSINTKLDSLKIFIKKSDLLVGIPKHLLIPTFDERFKSFCNSPIFS